MGRYESCCTGENPGGVVDQQQSQRLGVICFKALEDEFYRLVFLFR